MSREESAVPGGWRSGLVLALAVLAIVHSVLIALFLVPTGPVRRAAGADRLDAYVDPYFEQSWDALDPTAQRVDESFQIRVRLDTGKKKSLTTPWFDVTRVENRRLRHDVAPARMHDAARRLATNLNQAMFVVGEPGREAMAESFVKRSPEQVTGVLLQAGVDAKAVRTYAVVESMALRYASLYAQAVYDDPVLSLQIRVGRRTAPDRSKADTRVTDLPFEWFATGWRRAYRGSEDARAAFAAYTNRSTS